MYTYLYILYKTVLSIYSRFLRQTRAKISREKKFQAEFQVNRTGSFGDIVLREPEIFLLICICRFKCVFLIVLVLNGVWQIRYFFVCTWLVLSYKLDMISRTIVDIEYYLCLPPISCFFFL